MKSFDHPSSSLIERWENEAILQGVSCYEIGNFMKMKEKLWREAKSTRKPSKESIYTNAACNRLTEHGNKFVYSKLMEIPTIERIVKVARVNFEELQKRLSRGFADDVQRDLFVAQRDSWFSHLKEKMCEHKISKETLSAFGLNWKDAKSLAFMAV